MKHFIVRGFRLYEPQAFGGRAGLLRQRHRLSETRGPKGIGNNFWTGNISSTSSGLVPKRKSSFTNYHGSVTGRIAVL